MKDAAPIALSSGRSSFLLFSAPATRCPLLLLSCFLFSFIARRQLIRLKEPALLLCARVLERRTQCLQEAKNPNTMENLSRRSFVGVELHYMTGRVPFFSRKFFQKHTKSSKSVATLKMSCIRKRVEKEGDRKYSQRRVPREAAYGLHKSGTEKRSARTRDNGAGASPISRRYCATNSTFRHLNHSTFIVEGFGSMRRKMQHRPRQTRLRLATMAARAKTPLARNAAALTLGSSNAESKSELQHCE